MQITTTTDSLILSVPGMTPQQLLELLHSALACHASSAPETEVQEVAPILVAVSAELGL